MTGIRLKCRVSQIEAPQHQFRVARDDQSKIFRYAEVILTSDSVDFHPIEGRELYSRMQHPEHLMIDGYNKPSRYRVAWV